MLTDLDAHARPTQQSYRAGAIERTLGDISHALEQAWFAEQYVHRQGLFQRLDPRVKVVMTLAFLVSVGVSKSLPFLVGLYLLTLVLAKASAIPTGLLVRRVWLALPFFTAGLILPALFITPGPALLHLPLGVTVTGPGALAALFLLLRVSISVSLTLLLVLTTAWNSLLKALAVLKAPDGAVLILGMTYRYIFLLLSLADHLFLSRQSRVIGRLSARSERQILGASAGVLLSKSLDLSGEVCLAMQSRGFRGIPRTFDRFQLRRLDWLCLAISITIAGFSIWSGK